MLKLKTLLSLVLTPILLWASLGFSVNRHYCLGLLKTESFYHPAATCAMHEDGDEEESNEHGPASCALHQDVPQEPSNPEDYQWLLELDCCQDEWISVAPLEIESGVHKLVAAPQILTALAADLLLSSNTTEEVTQPSHSYFENRGPPRSLSFFLALWQRYLI